MDRDNGDGMLEKLVAVNRVAKVVKVVMVMARLDLATEKPRKFLLQSRNPWKKHVVTW
jgi:hypothetical protein